VHRFRCYDNIAPNAKFSECLYSLYSWFIYAFIHCKSDREFLRQCFRDHSTCNVLVLGVLQWPNNDRYSSSSRSSCGGGGGGSSSISSSSSMRVLIIVIASLGDY